MTTVDRLSGIRGSLAFKAPVKAATTENITLTGAQTVDGIALVGGERVLVQDQVDGTQNGIYDVSTGDWTRSKDFNGTGDIIEGTQVYVAQGTINGLSTFRLTTDNPMVIDVTELVFAATLPIQIPFVASGALGSSEELGPFISTGHMSFVEGLPLSQALVRVAVTDEVILSVQKNLVEVGTITFAALGTSGTVTSAGDFTLAAGDTLSIVAPVSIDATLSHFSATLRAFG